MGPEQVVAQLRAIRYGPPQLTFTEIARRAGLHRQTVYDAIQGRAGARALSAIGNVLDNASEDGAYQTRRVAP